MFLRRHMKQWGGDEMPSAMASFVAPGAHDLLAPDAYGRNSGTNQRAVERRPSVSLQVASSDLTVGFDDVVHVSQEQINEGCTD